MKRGLILATVLALGGCSLAPRYAAPEPPVPASWPVGDAYLKQQEAALPAFSYTDVFKDPRLLRLIDQALANNRDMRVAAANLAAARARVAVTRSAQFPEVGVDASAMYRSTNSGSAGSGHESYAVEAGISSFELDLFGRLANATKAQRDRALSTEAAARTVRLGLIADLASAWANYAADKELLAIAERTAENATKSVDLARLRLNGGIAPGTDVSQAEQVLATARGDVATQKTALAQDENILRLLVGASFDAALLPDGLDEIAASIMTLPAGMDSTVLLRRPDVIEAEYLLRAANADIGVARAELFPRISLSGLVDFASGQLSALFKDDAFRASGSANAGYALFAGGGPSANVRVTKAQRDAALASYEKAIQTAFREVADALADQGTLTDRLEAARVNSAASANTARLADARYRYGVDNFLSNLIAQRSDYSAQRAEIGVLRAAIENRITLYRVLGGDTGHELEGNQAPDPTGLSDPSS